jgi:hypothetical protein
MYVATSHRKHCLIIGYGMRLRSSQVTIRTMKSDAIGFLCRLCASCTAFDTSGPSCITAYALSSSYKNSYRLSEEPQTSRAFGASAAKVFVGPFDLKEAETCNLVQAVGTQWWRDSFLKEQVRCQAAIDRRAPSLCGRYIGWAFKQAGEEHNSSPADTGDFHRQSSADLGQVLKHGRLE